MIPLDDFRDDYLMSYQVLRYQLTRYNVMDPQYEGIARAIIVVTRGLCERELSKVDKSPLTNLFSQLYDEVNSSPRYVELAVWVNRVVSLMDRIYKIEMGESAIKIKKIKEGRWTILRRFNKLTIEEMRKAKWSLVKQ